MLVLSRKTNEETVITDKAGNVVAIVKIVSTDRGKVRIGFAAPLDVAVHRAEVYEQIYKRKAVVGEKASKPVDGLREVERAPHPATRMDPIDMDDAVHGDAVGRHD